MADVNTEWLKNLKLQIDAIPDCQALNKLIAYIKEFFQQLIDDLVDQIAKLLGLIVPPTSLAKIIKYLKNLATRYLGPYIMAIRQLAAMIKAFAEVLQAIQAKLAALRCSITGREIFNQLKNSLTTAAYQRLYSGNSTLTQLTSIYQRLQSGLPPLNVIATELGVPVDGLPAIANQYGGTLPFMSKMLDKYQPAPVPEVVSPTVPSTPTDITLDNPAPTIESAYKTSGGGTSSSTAGGTSVTINGSGFLEGVKVSIGSECTTVTLLSSTVIQYITESTPIGTYSIIVTNPDLQEAKLEYYWTYS